MVQQAVVEEPEALRVVELGARHEQELVEGESQTQ